MRIDDDIPGIAPVARHWRRALCKGY